MRWIKHLVELRLCQRPAVLRILPSPHSASVIEEVLRFVWLAADVDRATMFDVRVALYLTATIEWMCRTWFVTEDVEIHF
jgi:hypothetical protein